MRCPYCHFEDSKVIDSRSKNNGRAIRRRRECISCKRRFTTKEMVEETPLIVVKADQRREPFNREKLRQGIQLACSKRPISVQKIEDIASKVEYELREKVTDEVNSQEIGRLVMYHLKNLDQVAYVRFASVYRKFQDKEEFISELQEL
ncbi:transcriptional repressor NrdR [candidate division KSB1 bacterium]|nr:transcriptional repressor NrdR [candidate division KSB1 bacterium]